MQPWELSRCGQTTAFNQQSYGVVLSILRGYLKKVHIKFLFMNDKQANYDSLKQVHFDRGPVYGNFYYMTVETGIIEILFMKRTIK